MADAAEDSPMGMPQPGKEHALLAPFEGSFRAVVKIWTGPGDPIVSTGNMTNSWAVGNLYLHQNYIGDHVDGPFPNFVGQGFWGYNTATQKYEGFWIDNASTMMQTESGDVDDTGKVWTMHSELTNPQTGQLMKKRSVIKLVDQDHNSVEMYYVGPDGNEMKAMEIQYVRH